MTNKELREKITRLEAELAEVKEMAEEMKKRADGGGVFKPEYKQEYWFISRDGQADVDWWEDHFFDDGRYAIGNCFPTEQAAEDAIRVLKLIQKAKESQDGFIPDWENETQRKYSFYFAGGNICTMDHASLNLVPIFGYWEEVGGCEKFIRDNYDELIWFFTEYKR